MDSIITGCLPEYSLCFSQNHSYLLLASRAAVVLACAIMRGIVAALIFQYEPVCFFIYRYRYDVSRWWSEHAKQQREAKSIEIYIRQSETTRCPVSGDATN
jgi:hypothetical protein